MIRLIDKEGKDMSNLIYDLNQDYKNSKKISTYSIVKGKFISFKSDPEDMVHNISTPKLSKNRKALEQYIGDINGFVDGMELFGFYKEYKKFVTETELYDDFFVIKTSIPEVEYRSESLRSNLEMDYKPYKEFRDRAIVKCKGKSMGSVTLTDEQVASLGKLRAPIIIEKNGIRFKATHKLFLGLKAKSECRVLFFELDKKNKLYLVDIKLDNPNFTSENYFVIVNF